MRSTVNGGRSVVVDDLIYYVDAANASIVIEGGNLPPSVGITYPESGKINILGRFK